MINYTNYIEMAARIKKFQKDKHGGRVYKKFIILQKARWHAQS